MFFTEVNKKKPKNTHKHQVRLRMSRGKILASEMADGLLCPGRHFTLTLVPGDWPSPQSDGRWSGCVAKEAQEVRRCSALSRKESSAMMET